ncbi:MAG: hypothetical protein J1G02_00845 [Clostridiales bacterium]|nr:hypothetical protein [Clostridiales bacterium]
MDFFGIVIAALFADNFVLSQFLGICPFLGVSKKINSALGMGLAVTAVMVITCVVTYPIYTYLLLPLGLGYLQIVVFILLIAALVQMLEMILKKFSPGLYSALGIYLPLVTTNCAILGVAKIVTATALGDAAKYTFSNVYLGKLVTVNMAMGFGEAVLSGLFYGLGFTLAIVILAGLRNKVDKLNVAKALRGFPITMITACFMAMAFFVFSLI